VISKIDTLNATFSCPDGDPFNADYSAAFGWDSPFDEANADGSLSGSETHTNPGGHVSFTWDLAPQD
jgi:hypothetical protein